MDDEVELWLHVIQEYKAATAAGNVDWESSQSKYGDMLHRSWKLFPSQEEAVAMSKEFPHKKRQDFESTPNKNVQLPNTSVSARPQ